MLLIVNARMVGSLLSDWLTVYAIRHITLPTSECTYSNKSYNILRLE